MRALVCVSFSVSLLFACDDGGDEPGHTDHDAARADGSADAAGGEGGSPDAAEGDAAPQDAAVEDAAAPDADTSGIPPTYRLICAACHGPAGEGSQLGYEIRHPVRDFGEWVVRNGRSNGEFPVVMAPYDEAQVSDEELTEIWDWLDEFPRPETGEGLYLDFCANCHGETGRGGVTGVRIAGEAEDLRRKVRVGENVRSYGQRSGYMPAFSTAMISDEELALIEEYVQSL